ncbi:MAG TPA: urease accessory UreF family protein [Jatrophihabitans sp.]|jgi:urease accessory protein
MTDPPSAGLPVQLLLLLDSRSPAGAHNHSGGMESAVTAGWVRDAGDVEKYCRGRLHTAGRVAAAFAAASSILWQSADVGSAPKQWHQLDVGFNARMPSEAARRASRAMGSGLRRLIVATVADKAAEISHNWSRCAPPAPHQPLVLGVAVALTGGSPEIAARAAATGICAAPASAAVRLLGLDPYKVHAVMSELSGEIETIADGATHLARASRSVADLPADCAPALDLLADVHATSEVRLFAS